MAEILLTKGQVALIDDADLHWLNQWKWSALGRNRRTFYAARWIGPRNKRIAVLMHRELLGLPRGDKMQGDHKNGNGLDNRRENLRIATSHQNRFNSVHLSVRNKSGAIGVHWYKAKRRWRAQVKLNGKRVWVGHFLNLEDAIKARQRAAKFHFGEFAPHGVPAGGLADA